MTVQTDALRAACRRFPHMLTLARHVEARDFDWGRVISDVSTIRAEYRRVLIEQAKAAAYAKGSAVT